MEQRLSRAVTLDRWGWRVWPKREKHTCAFPFSAVGLPGRALCVAAVTGQLSRWWGEASGAFVAGNLWPLEWSDGSEASGLTPLAARFVCSCAILVSDVFSHRPASLLALTGRCLTRWRAAVRRRRSSRRVRLKGVGVLVMGKGGGGGGRCVEASEASGKAGQAQAARAARAGSPYCPIFLSYASSLSTSRVCLACALALARRWP
jgi:hypothetical protein